MEARFVDGPLGQATVKPVCFPGGLGGPASSMEYAVFIISINNST